MTLGRRPKELLVGHGAGALIQHGMIAFSFTMHVMGSLWSANISRDLLQCGRPLPTTSLCM